MPRVFVLNPREGLDITRKAEKYGEVVDVGRGTPPNNFETISNLMEEVVENWVDGDMLLPTASLTSSIMTAYFVQKMACYIVGEGDYNVTFLVFDNKTEDYVKRIISL